MLVCFNYAKNYASNILSQVLGGITVTISPIISIWFSPADLPFLLVLGVEKLVRHLHKHSIPLAVATGSGRQGYDAKITNHKELFQLVSHAVTNDDPNLQRCKPAPDIFQLAASRFPTPPTSPGHVLVFEDAPNGVTAARAAGMNVVMVPDKRVDTAKCSQAHMVLNSLEEFDPTVWGFPPFDSNFWIIN